MSRFQSIILFSLGFLFQYALTKNLQQECTVTEYSQVDEAIQSCSKIIINNVFVPGGKTLNLILKTNTTVIFVGNTTFGNASWAGPLVSINGTGLTIKGENGSILDGQGQLYWDGKGEWGSLKPKFFVIQVFQSILEDIYVLNPPIHTVLLTDSRDVTLSGWTIDARAGDQDVEPIKYGHNTDGIDVFNVTNLVMENNTIFNQDDCVAVRSGANILVNNFYCHGGHGLSISVGFSNDSFYLNTLTNVTFSNSRLVKGQNGIHIKCHVDAANGTMENITYSNIDFTGLSKYGINVQQNYRNLPANSTFPSTPANNIPIKNLHLKNVQGEVNNSAIPVYVLCAVEGCFDWSFENVQVTGQKSNNCTNYVPIGFNC